jgi:hypothetical protein
MVYKMQQVEMRTNKLKTGKEFQQTHDWDYDWVNR